MATTSKATTTADAAPHDADSHDLIRVHGARVNNLKDVSVEIPKRRLTVFTGVSGSGKSSLVFGTIAAESQRLINETYSAFVQGFMPTLARPEVDVLEGLTTAIIVDQERMGANPRSTVGTATDANAMLRILFSRLGKPHIGSPNAFSFNTATISGAGAVTIEKGGKTTSEKRTFSRAGGMCPRCEGMGSVTDFDLSQLYDDSKSLNEGALTIPGYSMDGWYGRIFRGCGFFDPDKPIRKFTKKELHDLLYKEPTKIKVDGINLTYEGLIPKIQKSFLSKDVDAMQPHIRAFVERAVTFTACPDCGGTRLNEAGPVVEDQGDQHRRRLRDADQRPGRVGARPRRAVGGAAARRAAAHPRLVRRDRAGLPLSLDRPSGTLSGGEAQRTKMIRHLGSSLTDVTYVFDEPTIGLHPHDIQRMNDLLLQLRDKGNTVLVVEHKPETIAIADHVVDLGPGAGTDGGEVVFEGTVEGLRASGTLTGPPPRRPGLPQGDGADAVGRAGGARRQPAQPAGRRRRHPARRAGGGDRRGRVGQELADPRLGVGPRRCGVGRPGRDQGLAAQQPGDVHRTARPDPQGVREGQRREAGAVQRQLRGRLPRLQRRRRHLHRPGDDGRRRHHLRGVRGEAVPGRRCSSTSSAGKNISEVLAMSVTEAEEFFGDGEATDAGRAQDPRPARRRRARLPQPRPAAHHAVRRRAAAAQAGHPHGREGRRLRPRRADHRPPPRRRRAAARPARPARRLRQVGHRHRAPPGGHGARRLDHRPRPRRRPRRRPDRLRGHTRRPRRRPLHPHRRAPRGLRRQLNRQA